MDIRSADSVQNKKTDFPRFCDSRAGQFYRSVWWRRSELAYCKTIQEFSQTNKETAMKIGFVSIDEVNRSLAQQMIPPEIQLECCSSGECAGQVDAWVYDLDQLPVDLRNHLLLSLC